MNMKIKCIKDDNQGLGEFFIVGKVCRANLDVFPEEDLVELYSRGNGRGRKKLEVVLATMKFKEFDPTNPKAWENNDFFKEYFEVVE